MRQEVGRGEERRKLRDRGGKGEVGAEETCTIPSPPRHPPSPPLPFTLLVPPALGSSFPLTLGADQPTQSRASFLAGLQGCSAQHAHPSAGPPVTAATAAAAAAHPASHR